MKLYKFAFILYLLPITVLAMSNDPVDVIRTTTERVLAELEKVPGIKSNPEKLQSIVEVNVLPSIDFIRLSSLTLGKHWRTASPEQRMKFTEGFKKLLIKTYSTSLSEYTGQAVEYRLLNVTAGGRRASVRTLLKQSGGTPVIVDYRLHLTDDHWKIYDVSIEGVSMAINYRSSFSYEIKKHGLDGLIQQLASRN
jgi:phospholipid transport system substrate-binding protein